MTGITEALATITANRTTAEEMCRLRQDPAMLARMAERPEPDDDEPEGPALVAPLLVVFCAVMLGLAVYAALRLAYPAVVWAVKNAIACTSCGL